VATRLVSSVLVGRATELAAIDEARARAAAGEPAVVLLAGEAGIGKTRLAAEAAGHAEAAGSLVLRGACVELGGEGLPFAPIVDALRALVQSVGPERLDSLLGPSRADLARLLPQLDPVGQAQPLESGTTARLFDSILGLVGRLAAEQPLVLLIEDLHWADRSTLDLLAFLVRALRDERVLVLLTYRSDELHRRHPLRPLLAELDRLRRVQRCELRRFDRTDVAAQLAGILGERPNETLVERVFARSDGNAFLVEEVLDLARDGGADVLPESLRDVLLARTDRLSDATRHVLQVAAVGGRRVPHALLGAVAGLPDGELDAALREAVERHVMEVDGDGYAFRHALLRDAIYDDLLPG
jgi:predicted ATPase